MEIEKGEGTIANLKVDTTSPNDTDGDGDEKAEKVKIQYVYTYLAVDEANLYDVVLESCASQNKSCRRLTAVNPTTASIDEIVDQIPKSHQAVSVLLLPRPLASPADLIDFFRTDAHKKPSVHILVGSEAEIKTYHDAWETMAATLPTAVRQVLPRKIHAFAPTRHHQSFPVNETSPLFLTVFRHVWVTYFGHQFPKDITPKRIVDAEGFRQCLFKPCTTATHWREAIAAVTSCTTNILEGIAVRSGVEVVKYMDMQARAVVYHPHIKPIHILFHDDADLKGALLYNSDLDPFYIACMLQERAASDAAAAAAAKTKAAAAKPDDNGEGAKTAGDDTAVNATTVDSPADSPEDRPADHPTDASTDANNDEDVDFDLVATYRILDAKKMTVEVRVCPYSVVKGGRSWLFASSPHSLADHFLRYFENPENASVSFDDCPFINPDTLTFHGVLPATTTTKNDNDLTSHSE